MSLNNASVKLNISDYSDDSEDETSNKINSFIDENKYSTCIIWHDVYKKIEISYISKSILRDKYFERIKNICQFKSIQLLFNHFHSVYDHCIGAAYLMRLLCRQLMRKKMLTECESLNLELSALFSGIGYYFYTYCYDYANAVNNKPRNSLIKSMELTGQILKNYGFDENDIKQICSFLNYTADDKYGAILNNYLNVHKLNIILCLRYHLRIDNDSGNDYIDIYDNCLLISNELVFNMRNKNIINKIIKLEYILYNNYIEPSLSISCMLIDLIEIIRYYFNDTDEYIFNMNDGDIFVMIYNNNDTKLNGAKEIFNKILDKNNKIYKNVSDCSLKDCDLDNSLYFHIKPDALNINLSCNAETPKLKYHKNGKLIDNIINREKIYIKE